MQASVVLAVFAALASCVPSDQLIGGGALAQQMPPRHVKSGQLQIPRSVRGFKNMGLSTARGFGKRAGPGEVMMQSPATPWHQQDSQQQDGTIFEQGMPVAWLADQLQGSPVLARLILRRFVDTDRDDHLSPEELLRTE